MNSSSSGSGTGGVVVMFGLLMLLGFLIVFLSSSKSSSSSSSARGEGGQSSSSPSSSPSSSTDVVPTIRDMMVDFLDNDTIVIKKTSAFKTGVDYGYFFFVIYDDPEMKVPYARAVRSLSYDVYMFAQETDYNDTYGYVWNAIVPPLQPNKEYWIRVKMSDANMMRTPTLGKISFVTPNTFSQPEPTAEETQTVADSFASFLMLQVVSSAIDIFSLLFDFGIKGARAELTGKRALYENLKKALKEASNQVSGIQERRIAELATASAKFKLFLSTLSASDIARLNAHFPWALKTYAKNINDPNFTQIWDEVASKTGISADAAKEAAETMASRILKTVGTIVGAGMDVADVILEGVALAGEYMDMENTGNMQDWQKYKTSDFLSMKEKKIKEQVDAFIQKGVTLIPAIAGPFFKYSNQKLYEKVRDMEIDLALLPKYTSSVYTGGVSQYIDEMYKISPMMVRYYRSLSRTGFIENEDDINFIENQQVMIDLRNNIQRPLIEEFKKNYVSITPPPSIENWAFNGFTATFTSVVLENTVLSTKLQKIAIYMLCKSDGGNPLKDGQCSYQTATACFNSYPWPMKTGEYVPSIDNLPDPTPCSSSPCLENSDTFGRTDFFYSEWRTPQLLKKDYPIGTDFRDDVNATNGVCTIVPRSLRSICESTTKLDASSDGLGRPRIIGRNNYNKYTGECTNTKQYCDSFGVSFTNSMPVSEMAGRGTGPLPSCYQSEADKAGAIILGGSSIIQYINIGLRNMNDFFNLALGIGGANSDNYDEELRQMLNTQGYATNRGDEAQVVAFNQYLGVDHMFSEDISIVDFKVDKFGNMYCLYAYGVSDGVLTLVKYDKFFNIVTNDHWDPYDPLNTFPFKGPVVNFVGCSLAIDDTQASLYVLKFEMTEYGTVTQKIIKRYERDGAKVEPQFREISPGILTEPGQIFHDNVIFDDDARFNGIFIRNSVLYVTYTAVGRDGSGNVNKTYSKFLAFSLTDGSFFKDIISNRDDYLRDAGIPTNEEIFSFVVDAAENHYSMFLNAGGNTKLVKFDNQGNKTEYNFSELRNYFDYDSNSLRSFSDMRIIDYPSLCIDRLNELILSTGFRTFKLDLPSSTASILVGMNKYKFFPATADTFLTDGYKPWEVALMDIDLNNNICQIIRRDTYVHTTLLGTFPRTLFNKLKPNLPNKLIKEVEISGIDIGIDYVILRDIKFSNCAGHENFSMTVTSGALLKNEFSQANGPNFGQTTVGQIKRFLRTDSLNFPLEPNKIWFNFNTNYSLEFKINGKVVRSQSGLSFTPADVSVNPFTVQTGFGDVIKLDDVISANRTRIVRLSSPNIRYLPEFAIVNSNLLILGEGRTKKTSDSLYLNPGTTYHINVGIPNSQATIFSTSFIADQDYRVECYSDFDCDPTYICIQRGTREARCEYFMDGT